MLSEGNIDLKLFNLLDKFKVYNKTPVWSHVFAVNV